MNITDKYILLKPLELGYLQSDVENPMFSFSLDGVDSEIIDGYLSSGTIEINTFYNEQQ